MLQSTTITRRGLLAGALGAAAVASLAACTSTPGPVPAGGTAGSKAQAKKVTGTLTFAFWGGSDGETQGFAEVKKRFEAANPGTTIVLKTLPYAGFFSSIDRGIVSETAPDLFRVDYTSIGKYISHGVLLDVTPYFSTAETEAFLPAFWNAVKYEGRAWGVPHQTDTTAVVYNKAAFASAGIGAVPDRLEDAWSWDEFSDVASKLRQSLPASKYPFAYDWTAAGAYRWSSFVYQAGGSLLTSDLKKPAVPSAASRKALDFTKTFFEKKWVPANNTIKTTVYSDNFFLNQTVPMTFIGDFLVPEIADKTNGYQGGEWATTFMPQDETAASDLGGNAIVAWKGTRNPDLAAAFLKFLVSEDAMKRFCELATELPTLQSLADSTLDYPIRPDSLAVFTRQATTITDTVVKETTVPGFASISTTLQDQLELGLRGTDTDATLRAIASGIRGAVAA
ncbi:ABC transporter substrate-binding protein [Frondihabitans cladoniiphilus]|uniref:Extracellular solute-binding protein n=1 Tax=Frondihabitans cladoniiphilus TaxID=715785 RepID=A0ABP8W2M5_9MICO